MEFRRVLFRSRQPGTPSPQPLSRFAGEGLEFRVPPPPFATLRPMEPLDTVYRWSDRMRDRARTGTFLRFLWRRFLDDRLFESAGALSFTMVFAMVPLSMRSEGGRVGEEVV